MKHVEHEKFMRRAIELSERAAFIEKSGGAFGAVIVKEGKIIGEGYNQVIKYNDPTCHGEVQAIRDACKKLGTPHLTGAILYTSAEPCPMCLCAAFWAHVDHIYYGARVEDALQYGGFEDLNFFEELQKKEDQRKIKSSELLRDEAVEVWKRYAVMPDRFHY